MPSDQMTLSKLFIINLGSSLSARGFYHYSSGRNCTAARSTSTLIVAALGENCQNL